MYQTLMIGSPSRPCSPSEISQSSRLEHASGGDVEIPRQRISREFLGRHARKILYRGNFFGRLNLPEIFGAVNFEKMNTRLHGSHSISCHSKQSNATE
jgi:hypothetical protein